MKKRLIGETLDDLSNDVKRVVQELVEDYRSTIDFILLKQAVDMPARARAQIQTWMDGYNAKNGANTAGPFLNSCLTAAGSAKTLTDVDNELSTLETQAATIVDNVNNNGWTWEQVADWLEANVNPDPEEDFTFRMLPIPANYINVWGESW